MTEDAPAAVGTEAHTIHSIGTEVVLMRKSIAVLGFDVAALKAIERRLNMPVVALLFAILVVLLAIYHRVP